MRASWQRTLSQRLPMITAYEGRIRSARQRLRSRALAPILGALAEQLRLQGKHVIKHAIYAPALQAVVGDDARSLEMVSQRYAERTVDPSPAGNLRLLEQLQTSVKRELAEPVLPNGHVPSTSTLPALVTRTLTRSSDGKE